MDKPQADRILSRYGRAGALDRMHMRGRLALCPYPLLLPHLTGAGNLLDVGCGFGHLAWYLREARPDLEYLGTDIDPRKIALAQGSLEGNGGAARIPRFLRGDARVLPDLAGPAAVFGNIVLLDVLYLMPWEMQAGLLEWGLGRLAPGAESALVVKTWDEPSGFSGFRALAEEWIMVRLLRRTLGSGTLNGMRPFLEYIRFAQALGFRTEIVPLPTFNPSSLLVFRR